MSERHFWDHLSRAIFLSNRKNRRSEIYKLCLSKCVHYATIYITQCVLGTTRRHRIIYYSVLTNIVNHTQFVILISAGFDYYNISVKAYTMNNVVVERGHCLKQILRENYFYYNSYVYNRGQKTATGIVLYLPSFK